MSLHPQVYDLLLKRFRNTGALVENGHFLYRSGRHGDTYIDHWRLLQDIKTMHHFCRVLAEQFTDPEYNIDVVVGPERGGGYVAMCIAYHLSLMKGMQIPWFFVSKNEEKNFHYLDAQFVQYLENKRALLVDDVVNTGGGICESIDLLREINGWPVGVAALANRGSVNQSYFPYIQKFSALFTLPLKSWEPAECPVCKEGKIPISTLLGHGRFNHSTLRTHLPPIIEREMIECSDIEAL